MRIGHLQPKRQQWQGKMRVAASSTEALTALLGSSPAVVHAAGVSWGGRAAVLCAPSGSGKSTLTVACLAAGSGYLSDEALGVDADGARVRGYAKPVTLKAGSWSAVRRLLPHLEPPAVGPWVLPAEAVRPGCAMPHARPALVVALRHDPAAELEVGGLTPGQVTLHLAANTSFLAQRGLSALGALARLAARCRGVRLRFTDAACAAVAVRDLLARPAPPPAGVAPLRPPLRPRRVVLPDTAAARAEGFCVPPGLSGLRLGAETLLLYAGQVHLLDPVSTAVWRLALEAGDADAVCAATVRRFADPRGRIRAEVAALLGDLSARGLLSANPPVAAAVP